MRIFFPFFSRFNLSKKYMKRRLIGVPKNILLPMLNTYILLLFTLVFNKYKGIDSRTKQKKRIREKPNSKHRKAERLRDMVIGL